MRTFEYEALDRNGRTRKGVVSADTARAARRELRRKQLMPVRVDATDTNTGAGAGLSLQRDHISGKDVSLVTRQMATLIGAAAPVEEAINTVAAQAEKPSVKRTLMAVRTSIMEGHRLSDALSQHPKSFDRLYCAMVAAGESSGHLGAVLDRLSDHLERSQKLRSKVRTAMIYPTALALTAIGVVIALMTFVVPKVVDQFDTMGQTLPALTRLMIILSDGMRDYGLIIAAGLAVAVFAFSRALKLPAFRFAVDRLLLRLPLVGKLVRGLNAARLARTLSTLIASGAPVLDGLRAAARTVTNTVLKSSIETVVTMVEEGASLSTALKRVEGFPPMVGYMAAAGENSGRLDDMLAKAASYMEDEFENITSAAVSLLEPAIIIVMGGVVATIVLSILLPIMQLNTLALG
ncbi:type II secretion system inner membrane protein GspF [Eilatimonas milleporae]|uniref:General secretion pathway protein F n=1 Tax=Eilatimonas milleporae TaxID=911205 RepID=A0A3M0CQG9_9PROT|nr:type II secretion system inner membrane protein GspF [Eilatimonas milleporae]RMB11801.1 type II secretion system protein F (GspF) [Eilatimonas milleporae]